MTRRWVELALGISMLILAGCSGRGPAAPAAGSLQDDFSGPACRFGLLEGTSSFGYGCADGEFRAWIDNDLESFEIVSASAGENYDDVVIEVDARLVEGETFSGAFVLCRGSQAGGDFYYFKMDHDSGAVGFYNDGDEQYVRFGDLPPGTDPLAWNRLRAECIGERQAFYVNGELVVELDDDSVSRGDIGLGAGEGEFGLTDVRFDNLVVSQP